VASIDGARDDFFEGDWLLRDRLLIGDSERSADICFTGEFFLGLFRLMVSSFLAASSKSSIKFLTGKPLEGLACSLSPALFSGETLKADCGASSKSASGFDGVGATPGAMFSWSWKSMCSTKGDDGGSWNAMSKSSSACVGFELAMGFSGENVGIVSSMMSARSSFTVVGGLGGG
jgi:hypothetical protein